MRQRRITTHAPDLDGTAESVAAWSFSPGHWIQPRFILDASSSRCPRCLRCVSLRGPAAALESPSDSLDTYRQSDGRAAAPVNIQFHKKVLLQGTFWTGAMPL
ncbi:uncharacterized protein [Triticum aestivum]|uniref:uncharacterized protein isoform X2 n=1 Tax=Triticum aestivum TaxID=4565 RepID=UPI001D0354CA|nr:uncharacterized protein LOC123131114 isoform X2 [Triticum aestivum]